MARKENKAAKTKHNGPAPARRTSSKPSSRYPQWKVDLFHAGIVERRGSSASDLTGRAQRAPGA